MNNKKIIEALILFVRKRTASIAVIAGCLTVLLVCASCGNSQILYENGDEVTASGSHTQTETADNSDGDVYITTVEEKEAVMVVHLCGAVNNPGVYTLEMDSRIIDGIIKAGGFTDDACEDALNLAMLLTDGSRIYVPTVEEVAEGYSDGSDSGKYVSGGDYAQMGRGEDSSGLVNINTAGVEKLMTLSGIGQSRANSIIAYREAHGAFKNIEDIKNVSGIKEAAFEKIKDYITVN